ncbi:transposase [Natronogracilivirga saccharolytica]|uniref:Transposase n=1 Tax=Natronogracilivirga saccharolytica TaxID=2812953 RepID=A0A8J7S821_9BACT|nr:transposase [Natronogracilivirga saccharolytica]MBP3191891.1 transposase [Natronogracilivirga saccharolytica]
MKRKRRHFSPDFKATVAIEALKERQSVNQLAEKYELHPNQITTWKKEFVDNADKAFSDEKANAEQKDREKQMEELYKQIGQMKVETDWLKKKLL